MGKLKVLECFAGLGACSKALTNLGIEHEIVDAVEIDKYAVASFNAIHGTNFEPQDITKWDKDIECDLIMHGSPCQDFSVAGKQAGGDEGSGTRSSLMYETLRIVEKLKPKYVIWENVKNLLSNKHRHNFDAYLEAMEKLGYKNYYQVLNAKDYGVPQNRERVFTVSIRLDIPYCWAFKFPTRRPLTKRLKDVLETEVDEKYYLSDEQARKLHESTFNQQRARENTPDSIAPTVCARDYKGPQCVRVVGRLDIKGQDQIKRVYGSEGVSPTLSTMQGGNRQPKVLEEPFVVASRGRSKGDWHNGEHFQKLEPRTDGITNTLSSVQKDNYVATPVPENGVSRTVRASGRGSTDRHSWGVIKHDMRIRKLTPKECWRLMGFDDADFEKAAKVNSNTQLYKQAGNSIVVDVLEAILEELLCK
jgi:DNA (cytosine-5)-methyltransferase 1